MSKPSILGLLVALLFTVAGCSTPGIKGQSSPEGDWNRITIPSAGISFVMPEVPNTFTKKQEFIPGGRVRMCMLSEIRTNRVYLVVWFDWPRNKGRIPDRELSEKVFDRAKRFFYERSHNGRLIAEREAEVHGFRTHEMEVDEDGRFLYNCRTYLADEQVYVLCVIRKTSQTCPEDIRRFLDSFTLTKKGMVRSLVEY